MFEGHLAVVKVNRVRLRKLKLINFQVKKAKLKGASCLGKAKAKGASDIISRP